MAGSLNKVQLIGNMTSDAEIRETPNGQKVATFSIATNRVWKDASGQKQEQVEFHNCVAWRGLADIIEQYTSKGKKLYIEGYLQTRSWDDPSGQKRYKTEVVADNIILLSPAGGAGGAQQDYDSAPKSDEKPARSTPKKEEEISIEDIPF